MKIKKLIWLSYKSLQSRKVRVAFTILSVAVGIGAILFLVSLGFGLQKNLLEKITTQESLLTLDIAPTENNVVALNNESLQNILLIPGVEKVSPQAIFSAQVSLNEINSETGLNLINPDWFVLSGVSPSVGRSFTIGENQKVVVNSGFANLFNVEQESLLGKRVSFTLFTPKDDGSSEFMPTQLVGSFEIVGVLDEQDTPPQAYLDINSLTNFPLQNFQFAKVKVKDSEQLELARDTLIGQGFLVSALSDTVDQANKIFNIIQIILGVFGVVALAVAAIGLVNTMTITLLQRTNEIGIMRAIGASPGDIKALFLSESIITGFLGGVAGIFLGIIVSQAFNLLLKLLAKSLGGNATNIFSYPLWFVAFAILLSTIVGLVAGFLPARRAAKLNPLDALRYK
ncbi:MAG: ABC transporter permease [Candidatus Pacebacteria bacterium]|nr:ABC transporter permease [Candidatus Paceibacterota bacterium]